MGCGVTYGNARSSDRLFPRVGGFGDDDGEEEGLGGNFFCYFFMFSFPVIWFLVWDQPRYPFLSKQAKQAKQRK